MNPLYGRDQYAGQFTRPAPAPRRTTSTTSPTSCSDSAARSRSATSSSPNLRQNMHFLYLQDDCARERAADAQPGRALRIRDAVGGAGQHPLELRSGDAADGDGAATARWRIGATMQARSQQRRSAPRSGLHAHAANRAARRIRHRATCTSTARAAATCCRSTDRRSSTRSSSRATRSIRRSGGPSRAIRRGSRIRRASTRSRPTSRTCRVTITRARCRAGSSSVQRELGRNMLRRRRLRRQPRRRPAAVRELQPGACRTTPPARFRCRRGGRFRSSRTSPTRSTAASRGITRCRRSSTGGCAADCRCSTRSRSRRAKDNGAGSLENPNGNFPAPQDFHNMEADFGSVRVSPAVQQHDQLRRGSCRSAVPCSADGRSPASTASTPASR